MGRPQLRDYVRGDWDELWPIVEEVITAQDTFCYDPAMSSAQAEDVWVVAPPGRTIVALDGASVVGSAHMGTNRPGPGAHVATASFTVARHARRLGVATSMCREVLRWAVERSYAGVQFNAVAASNDVAIRLYRREGFEIVGTVPGAFRHPELGRVGLHVMYCELAATP